MKLALVLSVWAASLVHTAVADAWPWLSYDPNTIAGCSFWYDNKGDRTCVSIRESWNISPETFSRWNPSISLDCKGWRKQSYCVGVEAELTRSSTTITSTPTTTTTTTSESPLWTDHGCYKDASMHPFQTQLPSPTGDGLTRLKCEAACWYAGYPYVGFKAGAQCWCGQYVEGNLSSSPNDCNVPCAGNSSETCGGDGVFNVVEGNEAPYVPTTTSAATTTTSAATTATSAATTTTASSPSSVSSFIPGPSETAFLLMSHYHGDCTSDVNNEVLVHSNSDGICIDTNCQVASLDVASFGYCPDGHVQVSYWQRGGCSGE